MDWRYVGIDDDPPKTHKPQQLVLLLTDGAVIVGARTHPHMIAWASKPVADEIKAQCQIILRGLPELRMVRCICDNVSTRQELLTALAHYKDDQLAQFTDLIRALDNRAHFGRACIPNFHR